MPYMDPWEHNDFDDWEPDLLPEADAAAVPLLADPPREPKMRHSWGFIAFFGAAAIAVVFGMQFFARW